VVLGGDLGISAMRQQELHHLDIAAVSRAEKWARSFFFEPEYVVCGMHFGLVRQTSIGFGSEVQNLLNEIQGLIHVRRDRHRACFYGAMLDREIQRRPALLISEADVRTFSIR
jgi:hypothetical protein